MKTATRIKSFGELHKSLTNPDEREKSKRITERLARRNEKRVDTGL